jgi:hypothetical protein
MRRLPNVAEWNEVETRADAMVEEWFYTVPPGGTRLTPLTPGERPPPMAMPSGSMRRLMRMRDEVNALGHELNEAVGGVLDPGSAMKARP